MRIGLLLTLIGAVFTGGVLASSCAAGGSNDDPQDCPIGSEGCHCTNGGSCDGNLVCLSDLCVNPDPTMGGGGQGTGGSGQGGENLGGEFNVGGGGGGGPCTMTGCKAVDVLFALDGSGSMEAEISALSATQSFNQVIAALANLNCGDIDYRIGVIDDYQPAFVVPNGWGGPSPWFDSTMMSDDEIATAFSGAAQVVNADANGPTPTGCEHVLTNSAAILAADSTGFIRPEALLVLVLVTDVDDYGAYDQLGGNSCGQGCEEPVSGPLPVSQIYDGLVALKGNEAKGVAAIVVGGDPTISGGNNFCGQPATCGCVDLGGGLVDCDVYHSDRLWQFAGMQAGSNGSTANLCAGPQSVPGAVQSAFGSNIDLACQEFEPPM